MTDSESPEPCAPEDAAADARSGDDTGAHTEAQRAADGLKDQIAAVRDRIRQARVTLTDHALRDGEKRSFKKS